MRRVLTVCVVLLAASCQAFVPAMQVMTRTQNPYVAVFASMERQEEKIATTRRVLLTGLSSLLAVVALPYSAQAAAGDALFKANPLTNSVLEQIRIWEQAEADNLKYGGELERGDAGNRGQTGAYPRLLVPILQMAYELETVNAAVQQRARYPDAVAILKEPSYNKIAFKKIFNQFSDNIYYSDPDRANLYLGGGGTCIRRGCPDDFHRCSEINVRMILTLHNSCFQKRLRKRNKV